MTHNVTLKLKINNLLPTAPTFAVFGDFGSNDIGDIMEDSPTFLTKVYAVEEGEYNYNFVTADFTQESFSSDDVVNFPNSMGLLNNVPLRKINVTGPMTIEHEWNVPVPNEALSTGNAFKPGEAFGGATIVNSVYTVPLGAEGWAGFAHQDTTEIYPLTFQNEGSITFDARVPGGGSASVKFRFNKQPYPDVVPSYETETVTITGDTLTSYTVNIPSQGGNTFSDLQLYVEQDVGVFITNVNVTADITGDNTGNDTSGNTLYRKVDGTQGDTGISVPGISAIEPGDNSMPPVSFVDLTGIDLSGANLVDADLRYTILVNANLSGANLTDANLLGSQLLNTNLSGATLTNVDLSNKDLTGVIWTNFDNYKTQAEFDAAYAAGAASVTPEDGVTQADVDAAVTAAEGERDAALLAKTAAESAQTTAEGERDAAVTAKLAAEGERDAAVTAKLAAESAQTAAEGERDAAVTAKLAAEGERDAAVTAKLAAESERDGLQGQVDNSPIDLTDDSFALSDVLALVNNILS